MMEIVKTNDRLLRLPTQKKKTWLRALNRLFMELPNSQSKQVTTPGLILLAGTLETF